MKTLLPIALALAGAFTLSCSSDDAAANIQAPKLEGPAKGTVTELLLDKSP